jgi:hypothetical protein
MRPYVVIRIRRQNEDMIYEKNYLYPEGGEVLRWKIPDEAPNCEPGPLRWQQDTRWVRTLVVFQGNGIQLEGEREDFEDR